ncbi:MAG: hypothetical protein ACJ8AT_24460 [Hyalangium sp.]|uniref:hypothetical protein n=1 Tax=Hyalangium sp. TaxID=2028555 RepID=UPI00389A91FB
MFDLLLPTQEQSLTHKPKEVNECSAVFFMKMRNIHLALAAALAGCLRNPSVPPVPVGDDRTIAFPQFFERAADAVGAEGNLYELDGMMLRAIMIAANDFLPPGGREMDCPNRQEAQLYRVIRQGDIVFVYIHEDEAYCRSSQLALDSGVKYAISADGRILRRVLDGQPEGSSDFKAGDGGPQRVLSRPGVTPAYDSIWNKPSGSELSESRDGGVGILEHRASPSQ